MVIKSLLLQDLRNLFVLDIWGMIVTYLDEYTKGVLLIDQDENLTWLRGAMSSEQWYIPIDKLLRKHLYLILNAAIIEDQPKILNYLKTRKIRIKWDWVQNKSVYFKSYKILKYSLQQEVPHPIWVLIGRTCTVGYIGYIECLKVIIETTSFNDYEMIFRFGVIRGSLEIVKYAIQNGGVKDLKWGIQKSFKDGNREVGLYLQEVEGKPVKVPRLRCSVNVP